MAKPHTSSDPQALINRAIADGRLAHALLIHGQNFEQIERFAILLAARLLGVPAEPDDRFEERLFRHLDLFALRPSKKSRVISVDDTREAIRHIHHSPQSGERKVAIVFEADRFNKEGANAFLKTLEEPPLNTTILLLTTRPHSLLPTIRSRCQNFRLPTSAARFDDPQAQSWLDRYRQWLSDLLSGGPGGRASIPHFIFGLYGLLEQFNHILESLAKSAWKAQSAHLPEDMSDDERIALESRIRISIRQSFLAAIELATRDVAQQGVAADPSIASKLAEAVAALENASDLLRLNMKTETALESFLVRSLRIWTAKG